MSFDYDSLPRGPLGSVIGPSLSAVTNPITAARLIPWERDTVGVEIKFEDGSSHAREVDASGLWRPIETAPKDGTAILVYWPANDELRWATPNTPEGQAIVRWGSGDWRLTEVGAYAEDDDLGERPTHWMPLTPAPQKQEGRG